MREDERVIGWQITQDNDPNSQCRSAKLIELLEVRRLIEVCDHDARLICVCPEGRVRSTPAHREICLEPRMVELPDELSAMLVVRVDQQCARIVRGESPGLHRSAAMLRWGGLRKCSEPGDIARGPQHAQALRADPGNSRTTIVCTLQAIDRHPKVIGKSLTGITK